MTKNERRELSKAIKDLPEMRSGEKMEIIIKSGASLLAAGVKEVQGKPVNPKGKYSGTAHAVINHRTNAEKAFKQKGMIGVHEYCNAVLRKAKIQLETS